MSDSQSAALWTLGLQSRVDVNRARVEELQVIPGIGPVLAKKIVVYREKNGYFQTIDDLTKVKGIGPKLIQRWEGLIVVQTDPLKEGAIVE
ncbi:MAG: helix-hairpin-helix domain-containing protein [Fidelibacterota bacterium]|nr:MAG: helix-hairpin-helix domain-containing protein [Candidatus Neomarinimicrobiota bacterium]